MMIKNKDCQFHDSFYFETEMILLHYKYKMYLQLTFPTDFPCLLI